jgi:O-antigen/teichoic acid export membrane protein
MSLPANFVSISFYDVFKQKALEDYKNSGEFRVIFIKFFSVLSIIAMSMIAVIYFFGPLLFDFIFGSKWTKAGTYAQYLCFLYAIRLVAGPLTFSLEVVNKHYINLIFQCLYLIIGVSSILITYHFTGSDFSCVKTYSFSLSILYFAHIFTAYLNTKKS